MLFIVNDFIIIFLKALLTPQNEKMWNGRSGAEVRCQSFIYFAWNLLMYIYLSNFFLIIRLWIYVRSTKERRIYMIEILYIKLIILGAKICFCFEIFSYLRAANLKWVRLRKQYILEMKINKNRKWMINPNKKNTNK